jgi:hypothetical protein
VQAFRLGKTHRTTDSPLDPRAHIDVFTLDLLCIGLPSFELLGVEMPLIGPQPSVKERVMPKGANSALRAKKTVSWRRPHTEANTVPVW